MYLRGKIYASSLDNTLNKIIEQNRKKGIDNTRIHALKLVQYLHGGKYHPEIDSRASNYATEKYIYKSGYELPKDGQMSPFEIFMLFSKGDNEFELTTTQEYKNIMKNFSNDANNFDSAIQTSVSNIIPLHYNFY